MEILKSDISYETSTKYINKDIVVNDTDKAVTSGVVVVSQNKLLIVIGTLICL